MEETTPLSKLPSDSPYAITIDKATFAWDKPKATVEEKSDQSKSKEELVFSTNDDGSVLCYPNGSVESLSKACSTHKSTESLSKTHVIPNGDLEPEDGEDSFTSPEQVPLRIAEADIKGAKSMNGSVVLAKDEEEGIVQDGGLMKLSKTKAGGGDVAEEEKVVRTLFDIDLELEKVSYQSCGV